MHQASLISLLEEPPVKASQLQDLEKDWLTNAVNCSSHIAEFLHKNAPDGWFGRTCPACCQLMEGKTLVPSSGRWHSSGMGSPTAFLTLNTLEYPSDEEESLLWDILETGEVPERYYLSGKACAGILERAKSRNKTLPELLVLALSQVVQEADQKGLL